MRLKFTQKKNTNTRKLTKMRLSLITALGLVALMSTAVFSSTTSAGSLVGFLFSGGLNDTTAQPVPATARPEFSAAFAAPVAPAIVNEVPADGYATVTTDRTDYNPGETVVITGSGFDPFEQVSLTILREGAQAAAYQVTADQFGNIVNREFVIGADDLGASFVLNAAGATSGKTASSKFTDGTMSYTLNSINFTGSSAVANSSLSTVSFGQTVRSPIEGNFPIKASLQVSGNSGENVNGNLTAAFPANFTVTTSQNELNFGNKDQPRTWTVSISVPANTMPGFYSAFIKANPDNGHAAGDGTKVIIEVKAQTPADTLAPSTAVNSGTYINNAWTNQNVTVSLSAVDNTNGSGIQSISYKIDNGLYVTSFASSVNVTPIFSSEGSYTITYFATDNAGNKENTQYFYVNIDKTKPVITLTGADVTLTYGDVFSEPGYTAADNRAPADLTSNVVVTGSVDTNAVGDYTLNYDVSDSAGNAADQKTRTVRVVKAGQTISFGALGNKTFGDDAFAVSAAGGASNNPVTFTSQTTGVCTTGGTNGATVTIVGAGTCTIRASQAGSSNYEAAADVDQSFTVGKAGSTTTVTCTAGPFTYNGSAQTPCSVLVTGAGVLNEAPTPVYSNNTGAGTATASYSFAETATHLGSSGSMNFTIDKADSTTVLTCPAAATYTGSAIEPCSATVTRAGGLSESVTVVYTNNVNAGTAAASATFGGDANHNGSSDDGGFTIDKASSVTTITCPASVIFTGSALEPCTASATGAGGLNVAVSVTYANNTNAGTATADAAYAGDANHNSSTATQVTFTISKAASTTTVTCSAGPFVYNGSAYTPCSVTVTGAGGLSLTPTPIYSNNTDAGTAMASYAYVGGDNHEQSSGNRTFTIDKASPTVGATGGSFIFTGSQFTGSCSVTGVGGANLGPLMPKYAGNGSSVYAETATAPSGVGTYTVKCDYPGNMNYVAKSATADLTIGAWGLNGFYQPVDMVNSTSGRALNTVKGGSTVPLKFNLWAGSTELKAVGDVRSFQVAEIPCMNFSPTDEFTVEITTTGGTSLRYDLTAGQFIQNWQTPKTAGKCYQVRMTARDGSYLDAYFKTK